MTRTPGFVAKTYVDRKVAEYCMASGQDLIQYCRSIEPNLPQTVALRVYDPQNGEHVDDLLNNGSILISTGVQEMKVKAPVMQSLMNDGAKKAENQPRRVLDVRQMFPDTEKNRMISVMKSLGVDYDENPLSDAETPEWSPGWGNTPVRQAPERVAKKQSSFAALIDALNN